MTICFKCIFNWINYF